MQWWIEDKISGAGFHFQGTLHAAIAEAKYDCNGCPYTRNKIYNPANDLVAEVGTAFLWIAQEYAN